MRSSEIKQSLRVRWGNRKDDTKWALRGALGIENQATYALLGAKSQRFLTENRLRGLKIRARRHQKQQKIKSCKLSDFIIKSNVFLGPR